MRKTLDAISISDLSIMYEEAVSMQAQALDDASARRANIQYRRIVAISKELKSRGKDGQVAFLALMGNSNSHVRGWAAFHVLDFCPDRAEAELERLARGPSGLARFEAEMILSQWRKGLLK